MAARNPTKKRCNRLGLLEQTYGTPKPALEFASPYELLVAVMLSAQCTDKRVNIVTESSFKPIIRRTRWRRLPTGAEPMIRTADWRPAKQEYHCDQQTAA